ncbi:MAG: hypothetical protein NC400_14125 [Clostridium sp.]|nr:hypothetical protein [Clostridium sp.]
MEKEGTNPYTIQLVLNKINKKVNFLTNNSELSVRATSMPTIKMTIAVVGAAFCNR